MNKMEIEIILPEDVVLVEETRTIFKDKDGKYYLSKEGAQEKLATHFKCNCGNGIREKYRIYCDSCEPPISPIPTKDWDGESMLYVSDLDRYFSDIEAIEEYCEENKTDKHSLKIFICTGNYLSSVGEDYWEDVFADDGDCELPEEVAIKLNELNTAIENHKRPMSWSASKYIANIKWSN